MSSGHTLNAESPGWPGGVRDAVLLEQNRNNNRSNNIGSWFDITFFSTMQQRWRIRTDFSFHVPTLISTPSNVWIMSSSAPSRLCLLRCLFWSPFSARFLFFTCVVLHVCSSALCITASLELCERILFILERFRLEVEIDLNVKYIEVEHMRS